VGDLYSLEMLLTNLGLASLIAGDLAQAKPRFMEALRIAGQIDDRVALYYLLDLLGCHAAGCGQARLAARLMGAGETIRTAVGARLIPTLPPLLAQAEAAAVASIGQPRFDAEVDAGRGLSREAALGLALGVAVGTPVSADGQAGPLGKREADVARLVAEGLSNKQIGSRLFISERTVDSHVRSILNKLGFNSRAQIAGWIASSKA
jgi:DNA-binding CsgD family transcriptional regulator